MAETFVVMSIIDKEIQNAKRHVLAGSRAGMNMVGYVTETMDCAAGYGPHPARTGGNMQLTEDLSSLKNGTITGLCVECAICRHDFSEMLTHGEEGDHFSEAAFPAAWINGRRYRFLVPVATQRAVCSGCDRRVASIYVPVDE